MALTGQAPSDATPSTFEPETRTDHGIRYVHVRNVGVAHHCGAECLAQAAKDRKDLKRGG